MRPREDRDDDALNWAREGADATFAVSYRARQHPAADLSPAEQSARNEDTAPGEASPSSALLVATGVVAGLYLLIMMAWLVTATRQSALLRFSFAEDVLGGGLYALGLWLAVAAPPVWFAVVLLATRDSRVFVRALWLAAGVVLLIPLPFLRGA
ncbi:hypothetical protein C5D30_03975 [Rathayibacter toxicus]|nr:hypothetical protein C5D30_03975 [Rathayibacter toxicus]